MIINGEEVKKFGTGNVLGINFMLERDSPLISHCHYSFLFILPYKQDPNNYILSLKATLLCVQIWNHTRQP